MALPGHRATSSKKRRRAAHFALKSFSFSACPKCKKAVLPHHACSFCGIYNGKQVVKVKETSKKGKKAKEKKE